MDDESLQRCLFEMQAALPSKDPAYWARKTCKTCKGHGEPILSNWRTTKPRKQKRVEGVPIWMCSCAVHAYECWKNKWIKEWLEKNRGETDVQSR